MAQADGIAFPDDTRAVDITKPPYNAVPDGKTDCTAAIQQALKEEQALIYLPDGVYLISDTLRWGKSQKRQVLQGQSEEGTIIRLQDSAPTFNKPQDPKAMIWTGKKPAQRFRNGIRNLTVDTGNNNPGAIGVQFIANNQGGIHHVTVRCGENGGPIGLDLGYTDEQGPCLISHVTVLGFDVGVRTKHAVDSVVLEHILVKGQKEYGFVNDGQCIGMRRFRSENSVPGYYNMDGASLTAMIDSEFVGLEGAADNVAIVSESGLFVRGITTSGYRVAIRQKGVEVVGPEITEYVSAAPLALFPSTADKPPMTSLNLPIKEVPEVPWDDPSTWTSIADFGPPEVVQLIRPTDKQSYLRWDWSKALQRAIDSGATTIYFPKLVVPENVEELASQFQPNKTDLRQLSSDNDYGLYAPVILRGSVRRIIGCEAGLDKIVTSNDAITSFQPEMRPTFILADGEAPAVIVERFASWYASPRFEQRSKRTLIISSMSIYDLETEPGSGDVFLEDVRAKKIHVYGSSLWARQINPEGHENPRVLCDAGTVWILGLKTETDALVGLVRNGGKMEIIGGFNYGNKNAIDPKTLFVNEGSSLSFTSGGWVTKRGAPFHIVVRETQGDETRELKHEDIPHRGYGHAVHLYIGRPTENPR